MPRKLRRRKPRIGSQPLSMAWKWTLVTGTDEADSPETAAMAGWVDKFEAMVRIGPNAWSYQPPGDALWKIHGDALRAETAEFGFEPYWYRKERPSGAGFEQWRAAMVAEHQRQRQAWMRSPERQQIMPTDEKPDEVTDVD